MNHARERAYLARIDQHEQRGERHLASYLGASLRLERTRQRAADGRPARGRTIDSIASRFEEVAQESIDAGDIVAGRRAALLGAFTTPLAVMPSIPLHDLSDRAARSAYQALDLDTSAERTAELLKTSIVVTDKLNDALPQNFDLDQLVAALSEAGQHTGFIQEGTAVLHGLRDRTVRQLVVPTLAYDDMIAPQRADAILLDNRRRNDLGQPVQPGTAYPFQAKTTSSPEDIRYAIPVVYSRDLGNMAKTSHWPTTNKAFMAARTLAAEYDAPLDDATDKTLQRIRSHLYAVADGRAAVWRAQRLEAFKTEEAEAAA